MQIVHMMDNIVVMEFISATTWKNLSSGCVTT